MLVHRLRCTCIQRRVRISWTTKGWKSDKRARDVRVRVNKDVLELAGPPRAGRVISKLVMFADAVLTVSYFFAYRWMK